jgi:uncharacterized protein with ATP-grasp and redox domains
MALNMGMNVLDAISEDGIMAAKSLTSLIDNAAELALDSTVIDALKQALNHVKDVNKIISNKKLFRAIYGG